MGDNSEVIFKNVLCDYHSIDAIDWQFIFLLLLFKKMGCNVMDWNHLTQYILLWEFVRKVMNVWFPH
jgi:hypothetical protein